MRIGDILTIGRSLLQGHSRKISARIPHQSKIGSKEPIFDSFPPGEAMVRCTFQQNASIQNHLLVIIY